MSTAPPEEPSETSWHRPPGLHTIRGIMGCCHLLVEGDDCMMLDAGLFGEKFFIRRVLRRLKLRPQSVKAILLTHGHLDHTGNLAWLREWTGAGVFAHPAEQAHVDGVYPYQGVTRWCGRLEAAGRALFRYRPAKIDEFLSDGQWLPFWGGLRVIHLPGHTAGHCGFFSERHDLLFSGDTFASYFFNIHKPPAILNSVPEKFAESVAKIHELNPRFIIPSHYDWLDGALHRRRFARLFGLGDRRVTK
jgi:glyoxylase-like metal-dependent hydrolase (beta-lactamase superfamily II)